MEYKIAEQNKQIAFHKTKNAILHIFKILMSLQQRILFNM